MKPQLITVTQPQTKLTFTKGGVYVVFFRNISGEIVCDLAHSEAKVYMFGLYTIQGSSSYKLTTQQLHSMPGAFSQLSISCVAEDSASLAFSGLIRIIKGAQQSHAYQKNQNLILSPNAFVDTRPMLEIEANDVFCTHGSTTGTINKEHVAYMMTRGMSKHTAEKAYVEGFIQQMYNQIAELGVTV